MQYSMVPTMQKLEEKMRENFDWLSDEDKRSRKGEGREWKKKF